MQNIFVSKAAFKAEFKALKIALIYLNCCSFFVIKKNDKMGGREDISRRVQIFTKVDVPGLGCSNFKIGIE